MKNKKNHTKSESFYDQKSLECILKIISIVSESDNPLTQAAIKSVINKNFPELSSISNKMINSSIEDLNLIRRSPDRTHVYITQKGRQFIKNATTDNLSNYITELDRFEKLNKRKLILNVRYLIFSIVASIAALILSLISLIFN